MPVQYTEHVFPHEVRHEDVTGHISLYAEKGRKRITYRYYDPRGTRGEKDRVPEALGAAGDIPPPNVATDEAGDEREVRYVPALVIKWAQLFLVEKADERLGHLRERAAASVPNHVRLGYVFKRVRESEWYRDLAATNRRRLLELDLPMRWVESALGSNYLLSRWDTNTLGRLRKARCVDGISTTTPDGRPTFLKRQGENTFAGDMVILKSIFEEAGTIRLDSESNAWLLDVNPMARLKRKMPKPGMRKKREVIDVHRYELLLSVADEVDPSSRFRYLLILLRWTGRRVGTILRLTRGVLLLTEEDIFRALNEQLCVYVLPHEMRRTARLYARNGGAMYVRYWMVKQGVQGEPGRAEQFDAVHPVHPLVMEATNEYLEGYWSKLRVHSEGEVRPLGPDDPLIPGAVVTKRLSEESVYSWFRKAARLLAERGTSLEMSPNNALHGLRSNRKTELLRAPAKYSRWLTEASVLSGNSGITVHEGVYQGFVPPELVKVVLTEAPEWNDDWDGAEDDMQQ
jgi:hypothetical protein